MGACGISRNVKTYDIYGAFNKLSRNAGDRFNGEDYCEDYAYSGDWNTIDHLSVRKVYDKYTKTRTDSWLKKSYDDAFDVVEKRCAIAYDMGVVEYVVISVKKSLPKNKKAPKYKEMYTVCELSGFDYKVIKEFQKATDADAFAKKYVLENGTSVKVKKERVLVSGDETTANYELESKSYKTKPKNIKKGGVLKEVHFYILMGMASC